MGRHFVSHDGELVGVEPTWLVQNLVADRHLADIVQQSELFAGSDQTPSVVYADAMVFNLEMEVRLIGQQPDPGPIGSGMFRDVDEQFADCPKQDGGLCRQAIDPFHLVGQPRERGSQPQCFEGRWTELSRQRPHLTACIGKKGFKVTHVNGDSLALPFLDERCLHRQLTPPLLGLLIGGDISNSQTRKPAIGSRRKSGR